MLKGIRDQSSLVLQNIENFVSISQSLFKVINQFMFTKLALCICAE
jgi:hypothetical protein